MQPLRRAILEPLAQSQPNWGAAHYELGLTLGVRRNGEGAVAALRRAVSLKPEMPDAWRALGDHLTAIGDAAAADEAYAAAHQVLDAGSATARSRRAPFAKTAFPWRESLLRTHLKQYPTDVPALRMLAEVAARCSGMPTRKSARTRAGAGAELRAGAAQLRSRPASSAQDHGGVGPSAEAGRGGSAQPELPDAEGSARERHRRLRSSARIVCRRARGVSAQRPRLDELRAFAEDCESTDRLRADVSQEHRARAATRRGVLEPGQPEDVQVPACRYRGDADAAGSRQADAEDRFHFSLRARQGFEDAGQFAESFKHYEEGNSLRRKGVGYDADWNSEQMRRAKALFTPEFFAARAGQGAALPIRSSSSACRARAPRCWNRSCRATRRSKGRWSWRTSQLVRELGGAVRSKTKYPESIAALDADALRALGERYLELTRIYRRTDAPFFIDKLPNNFAHTGLIH
jgi:tetratricopeptide (TPR) repeat protein